MKNYAKQTFKSMRNDDTTSTKKLIRFTLGSLLAFLALNAFGGGYYGMTGARQVISIAKGQFAAKEKV